MYSLATYTLHYITSIYNGRKDVCTEMETMCMCVSSWAANSAETAGRGYIVILKTLFDSLCSAPKESLDVKSYTQAIRHV
jgi:hypothetical protein